MSKELEAFERIRTAYPYCRYDEETQDLNIIESALKEKAELDKSLSDSDNSLMRGFTYKGKTICACSLEHYDDLVKKEETLDIIKEKGCLQFCMLGVSLKDYNNSVDIVNKDYVFERYKHYTQEEFDLLKEVLL